MVTSVLERDAEKEGKPGHITHPVRSIIGFTDARVELTTLLTLYAHVRFYLIWFFLSFFFSIGQVIFLSLIIICPLLEKEKTTSKTYWTWVNTPILLVYNCYSFLFLSFSTSTWVPFSLSLSLLLPHESAIQDQLRLGSVNALFFIALIFLFFYLSAFLIHLPHVSSHIYLHLFLSFFLFFFFLLPLSFSLPRIYTQATNGVGSGISKVVKLTVRGRS